MAISIPKRVARGFPYNTPPDATNDKSITRTSFLLTRKAKIIVLRQGEGGGYVDGYWQDVERTAFLIYGNAQPLKGNELLVLPESDRSNHTLKVYTNEKLKTIEEVEAKLADMIVWDGLLYTAYKTMTYGMGVLDHTKTLFVALPQTPENLSVWEAPLGMLGVDGAEGMSVIDGLVGGKFTSSENRLLP